jgi:hypothetical protein
MTNPNKLADAPITHDQAAEAVDAMDDCAKMDVSVDPFGPRSTLERYIAQQRALAEHDAQPALLTNPHTGTPRDYRDVESDPAGTLIVKPGEPLRAAPQPAPVPVQADDALGRFGHHPDPATDFEVEVTSLQGRLFNAKHAIPDKHGVTESVAQVADAIKRAMTFRVGGVETSVRAKSILRALEQESAHPPAPAADGAGELLSMIDDVAADLTDHKSLAYEKLRKVRAAIAALRQPVPDAVQTFTTGHCKNNAQPGGCQLHNLHCGYPACDRRPIAEQQESRNAD